MSREELVNAYVDGGVSRRTFIRRLVAAGVSLGAAVSYAHLLAPNRAGADNIEGGADFYRPEPDVDIRSKSLEGVVEKDKIKVLVEIEEPALIKLVAKVPDEGKLKTVGRKFIRFTEPGAEIVRIRLNNKGERILGGREGAKVKVLARAWDDEGLSGFTKDKRKLK